MNRPSADCSEKRLDHDPAGGRAAGCVEPSVRDGADGELARPQVERHAGVCERAADRAGHPDAASSRRSAPPPLSQFTQLDRAAVFQVVAAAIAERHAAVETEIAASGFGEE